MTQSKHTPGPWETDCKDHDAPYQNITVNSGYRSICTLWIDDAPVHDYNEEQEANARLIAESPTMHDLLLKLQAVRSPRELHNLRCEVAEVLARIEGTN